MKFTTVIYQDTKVTNELKIAFTAKDKEEALMMIRENFICEYEVIEQEYDLTSSENIGETDYHEAERYLTPLNE
jgi:hypothetical protein